MGADTSKAVDYSLRSQLHRIGVTLPTHAATLALAVSLVAIGCAVTPSRDANQLALVEAERAFARHAEASDVRTAFLAAFAEDGILMTPAPMRLRDFYAARPAPADPRAVRLEWAPVASGIAASGDFGYTSGPSTTSFRDGSQPPRHGAYFSVWRYAGGRWQVVLDTGITSPAPIPPESLLPSATIPPGPSSPNHGDFDALRTVESGSAMDADAFTAVLATDARLYRHGSAPVAGFAPIRAALADVFPFTLSTAGGAVASSGDLAYTYGTWRAAAATGHYVHLWTRTARGRWAIAVAIRLGAT
jgi:ketosteroid isomerase-like protein